MSAAFTSGPWQSKHDYTVEGATTIIANVDGESFSDGTTTHTFDFICTCEDEYGERLPNAQANARLIRAAPDLYAALTLWLAYDDQDEADFAQAGPMLLYARAIDATRKALAKARGEQSL